MEWREIIGTMIGNIILIGMVVAMAIDMRKMKKR